MNRNEIPLFDGHCDTLLKLAIDKLPLGALAENSLRVDLKRGLSYKKYAQFFAIFAEPDLFPGEDLFDRVYGRFSSEMDYLKSGGFPAALCACKGDADRAAAEGKAAVFLSVEGAEVLGCVLKRLEAARVRGVRSLCLSWNRATELTGTCVQDMDRGLSQKGRDFVRLAGELGVIVDVSHISDRGFWDVAKSSKAPFIASHSNSRAVCAHPAT
jgi:membrane dipeptidase